MTLTPDRKRRKSNRRARRTDVDSRADAGRRPPAKPNTTPAPPAAVPSDSTPSPELPPDAPKQAPDDPKQLPSSLAEQLSSAGLDLTGHYFSELFDTLDPVQIESLESVTADSSGDAEDDSDAPAWVPDDDEPAEFEKIDDSEADSTDDAPAWDDDPSDTTPSEPEAPEIDAAPVWNDSAEDVSTEDVPVEDLSADVTLPADPPKNFRSLQESLHPLLPDAAWNDLADCAPEITDAIASLNGLDEQLRTFNRPMGPDEALHVIDGAEALRRLSDSLSTLALSVYERVGTPKDSGAKSAKDLIRNRLNLTGREANRRAKLAENLGGRVTIDGQRLDPEHPLVAEQFHLGTLSAEHVTALEECLNQLPAWTDQATKSKVESDLVRHAMSVTVNELRDIFRHMLAYIDPDGAEPLDADDRSAYYVTARAKRNGDWKLDGVLDPVAGAELHGLLTSRIDSGNRSADPAKDAAGAAYVPNLGSEQAPGEDRYESVDAVLAGDRLDAPEWAAVEATRGNMTEQDTAAENLNVPAGFGVREDGTTICLIREQPTAKNWIYERFATLISRISMKEASKGSPYTLVITAKASDVANGIGEATTGSGDRFPMSDITRRGLNGTIFYHLMDEKARTVEVRTDQRFANKKQTAIITARDRGCVFPGCEAPAGWCDVNHVVPHSKGGRTDINNLCLLCSYHHHLMDRSDWEVFMLADGRPAWRPPESIDPARTPILHSRFITDDIIDGLFDF